MAVRVLAAIAMCFAVQAGTIAGEPSLSMLEEYAIGKAM